MEKFDLECFLTLVEKCENETGERVNNARYIINEIDFLGLVDTINEIEIETGIKINKCPKIIPEIADHIMMSKGIRKEDRSNVIGAVNVIAFGLNPSINDINIHNELKKEQYLDTPYFVLEEENKEREFMNNMIHFGLSKLEDEEVKFICSKIMSNNISDKDTNMKMNSIINKLRDIILDSKLSEINNYANTKNKKLH